MKKKIKDTIGGGASSRFWKVWHGGRSAIWIHKRWDRTTWRTILAKEDVVGIEILGVQVYSVYSPGYTRGWITPIRDLLELPAPEKVVVAGDFNMHHPMWSGEDRHSQGTDILLELAAKWQLELITTPGEPTWHRQGCRSSTLDLLWGSEDLRKRYDGAWNWSGSDHVPQAATIWLQGRRPLPAKPRPNWKMMDKELVQELASGIDVGWAHTPGELDAMVDRLVSQLDLIRSIAVPDLRGSSGGRRSGFWNQTTIESTKALRIAEREARRQGTPSAYQRLQAARNHQKQTLERERRTAWRELAASATKDPKKLWTLAAWGRLRSHSPTEDAQMPELVSETDPATRAVTHEQKAAVLAERFFPLTIPGERPSQGPCKWMTAGMPTVTEEDVGKAIHRPSPWKAPGLDGIPNGFLRACGKPVVEAIRRITACSLAIGHFPARFKEARVIVLRKPGKTSAQLQSAGGWRPISLLSCIGKVVETVMATKMTRVAEEAGILPPEQMGNRAERSTELAARFVTETVRAAWDHRRICSMLQLDLKGAFDRVHHGWLIATLEGQGWPRWVTKWVRSFLQQRTATITFDDWESEAKPVRSGVPQGSPLSPLLFILFSSSLFDELRDTPGIGAIGFADDTNLLAVGRTCEITCEALSRGWDVCEAWAARRGMIFEPAKSVLIHFSRTRKPCETPITLSTDEVFPTGETRFLGVHLDRRLTFGAHRRYLLTRIQTQRFALSRIAAATWGPGLLQTRQVYLAVIRSMLTYAASVFITPKVALGGSKGRGRGVAVRLASEQNKCLRTITGAYRSTPIGILEAEANCPPLNIVLARQAAAAEARANPGPDVQSPWKDIWKTSSALIHGRKRRIHKNCKTATNPPLCQWNEWATEDCKKKAAEEWKRLREKEGTEKRRPKVGLPWKKAKKIWSQLSKGEAACLVQLRSGHIGLRQYLARRGVPGVDPWCLCGNAQETPAHIFLSCEIHDKKQLTPLTGYADWLKALEDPSRCPGLVRWFLSERDIMGLGDRFLRDGAEAQSAEERHEDD